ncbi:hypothetical protein RRG08_036711 [Elysia crispata]|uniref:Uncharacterized protein n=1 Tax=Elysia crispata TaxID=231223 RepID=A0AAE0XU73_9GAST|nr:hypothetical protein RRG08_036711 [Elysia crispata]
MKQKARLSISYKVDSLVLVSRGCPLSSAGSTGRAPLLDQEIMWLGLDGKRLSRCSLIRKAFFSNFDVH